MHDFTMHGRFYRKAGFDRREMFFFLLLAAAVFLKFYFLEFAIASSFSRDFISAAASAGTTLLLIVPISLLWRRIRPFFAFIVDFLLTVLVLTDLLYMRYYSDLFTFLNIGLSAQVGEISETVRALINPSDFLYFIDIPILLGYIFFSLKLSVKPFFKKLTFQRIVISVFLIISGTLCLYWRIASYEKTVPNVLRSMWDRPAVCNNVGAMTYHVADAWNTASDIILRRSFSRHEVDGIKEWFVGRIAPTEKNSSLYGAARGKNLIVIQVESLQQFVVGLKVNGAEVTPNINRFIRKSVYFSRVYNQTGAGNSSDAEFLVNAGLYPSAAGVAYTRFAGNSYDALPKQLAANGYNVLALHGDRPGFWNRQHMYPSMGFQKFISKKDFTVDENIGMGLSDKSFFRQVLEILDREHKPFYAFIVTLTSHYPYNFPEISEQAKFNAGVFKGTLMGDYLTSMRYFDNQFGTFIKGLEKKGLLDSSVIIVYGDHTAIPAWDRRNLEKLLSRSLKSSWAWRNTLKIPLIIRIPGGKVVPSERKDASGLIDVSTTAAGLLGIPAGIGFGNDLFGKDEKEPVIFRNGSFITGNSYVEPSTGIAVDIRNGKKLKYSDYRNIITEVNKRLRYNDMILENDLITALTEE